MGMLTHFEDSEFNCKCKKCKSSAIVQVEQMSVTTLHKLALTRDYLDMPIKLNSAFRCIEHNRAIGSKDTSSHPKGYALDIHVPNSLYRYALIVALAKAGFNRIGIAKTFIHADDDPDKPAGVIWVYD
jgi:uncharacterized protein YcbK (DUF882 family)